MKGPRQFLRTILPHPLVPGQLRVAAGVAAG
jgi:hypothetical protein